MTDEYFNNPELKARHKLINPKLEKAGWEIQNYKNANVHSSRGVAVEFFKIGKEESDYVLFVNGIAVGIIEAKKEGITLIGKEVQSNRYAKEFPKEFRNIDLPLPFVYESNGHETRFTNLWDPKPRSRFVFNFYKPETFEEWIKHPKDTLRSKLAKIPPVNNKKLWKTQEEAINNILSSLAKDKPKALVQMATGSGKTLMAVNLCNDLIENAKAKRILFLVDRRNLGKQALQEFQNFEVPRDGRKFTELHNVDRLTSNKIRDSDKVCIATIQRVYSMLMGKELDESEEDKSAFEGATPIKSVEIKYNPKFPIETFDFIIVDECHRSIYNLWKQVLDYFDDTGIAIVLPYLISISALPLKHVEESFAIDSTGFANGRFDRWLNVRTQEDSKKRGWRKCHVVCGVKTNIITSVEITEGKANDSPMFTPLLKDTANLFNVKEISADKGYSSRANLELAKKLGAMPYIPFKKNVKKGKSKGSPTWSKMFEIFTKNYMEFAKHYHKRSNIESTFAMIKRKFGDFCRCKTEKSMDNEILCKVLTHNIVCLIHEIFELKIEIDFKSIAKTLPAQKVI